jgi:hypothetical protein
VDARGKTVDFRPKRDVAAAKAFSARPSKIQGRVPPTEALRNAKLNLLKADLVIRSQTPVTLIHRWVYRASRAQ